MCPPASPAGGLAVSNLFGPRFGNDHPVDLSGMRVLYLGHITGKLVRTRHRSVLPVFSLFVWTLSGVSGMKRFVLIALLALIFNGCMSASQHREQVRDDATDRMTVGVVQREIRVGMSGAEVAQVLGAPNIVSTDENRREVWIYDKVATEVSYSQSSGGIASLLVGIGGAVGGAVLPSASRSAGASSSSQRTLTVVIKFDDDKKVRDFAYHTSQF